MNKAVELEKYFRENKKLSSDKKTQLFSQLPEDEQREFLFGRRKKFFIPENKGAMIETSTSPSNKYRLDVYTYKTTDGGWNYTLGEIYCLDDNIKIGEVFRNYPDFIYYWAEDTQSGDFLLCGEDYQCQTVVDLKSGQTKTYAMLKDVFVGYGFCWASISRLDESKILVEGCYWGGPSEYRVYDISNPMHQLKHIELEDSDLYLMAIENSEFKYNDGLYYYNSYHLVDPETGFDDFKYENILYEYAKKAGTSKNQEDKDTFQKMYDDLDLKIDSIQWVKEIKQSFGFKIENDKLVKVKDFTDTEARVNIEARVP
jgi:hypothetical protein